MCKKETSLIGCQINTDDWFKWLTYLQGILQTSGIRRVKSHSTPGTIRYLGQKLIDGSILPIMAMEG